MIEASDKIPAQIRDFLDSRKETVFRQINDEKLPVGEVFKTVKNEGYPGDFHFFASWLEENGHEVKKMPNCEIFLVGKDGNLVVNLLRPKNGEPEAAGYEIWKSLSGAGKDDPLPAIVNALGSSLEKSAPLLVIDGEKNVPENRSFWPKPPAHCYVIRQTDDGFTIEQDFGAVRTLKDYGEEHDFPASLAEEEKEFGKPVSFAVFLATAARDFFRYGGENASPAMLASASEAFRNFPGTDMAGRILGKYLAGAVNPMNFRPVFSEAEAKLARLLSDMAYLADTGRKVLAEQRQPDEKESAHYIALAASINKRLESLGRAFAARNDAWLRGTPPAQAPCSFAAGL